MKQSQTFIRTIHEVPSQKIGDPNEMLIRAGYIRNHEGEFTSYLPLAKRVLAKIEKIIREQMNQLGANEISLPQLNSLQSLKSINETEIINDELFHMVDHRKEELYLLPSHEEIVTSLVKEEITSYEQLPFVLYQIQTKFRDELKTKGLFKSREFLMKDAYSFHPTMEDLNDFYEKMEKAYSHILTQLGLSYKKVLADLGGYRGETSHEFIVLSDNGHVTIAHSDQSEYAVNIELAEAVEQPVQVNCEMKELTKRPIMESLHFEDFLTNLNISKDQIIKTKTYIVNEELVVVLYRGDHILNEVKLKSILNVQRLQLANDELIREMIGCSSHSVGPIKLPILVKVIADFGIKTICNGVAGGNEDGFYYENVNPERDFAINAYEDLRYVMAGEPSPAGVGMIELTSGYEVGHTFKLGSAYTEEWNATFVDEYGDKKPLVMGAYGLGVSRLLAVASEIHQDDKGFIWPNALAPFDVHLIPDRIDREEELILSDQLHNILTAYNYEVLFDDRSDSIDVKLKDADLIGLPVRVIVGEKANDGIVEVQYRRTGETFECAKEVLIDHLNEFFRIY